jgi:anti-sigma factor RsiW
MTGPADPIGERDLLAYVDGLLDPARRQAVEAQLAADPAAAARIADFAAQRTALRSLYDPVLDEPVPPRLAAVLDRPDRRLAPALARIAAVVALTAGAFGGGWWLRGPDAPPPSPALASFLTQTATATPAAWAALPTTDAAGGAAALAAAPDLGRYGYTLVGRSRAADAERPVERLDYAGPDGRRLTLFLGALPWQRITPTPLAGGDGLYWAEGPHLYALTGEDGRLSALAAAIREQLSPPTPALNADAAELAPPARQQLELAPAEKDGAASTGQL